MSPHSVERRLQPARTGRIDSNEFRSWPGPSRRPGAPAWNTSDGPTHFHVPVFLDDLGAFGTTRFALEQALAVHEKTRFPRSSRSRPTLWDVLPSHLETGDI